MVWYLWYGSFEIQETYLYKENWREAKKKKNYDIRTKLT